MAAWWFAACSNPVTSPERVDEWPDIYPDYIGVTIPATIAPMNFNCIGGAYERVDVTVTGGKSGEMHVNDKIVSFPQEKWQKLLEENKGGFMYLPRRSQRRTDTGIAERQMRYTRIWIS